MGVRITIFILDVTIIAFKSIKTEHILFKRKVVLRIKYLQILGT